MNNEACRVGFYSLNWTNSGYIVPFSSAEGSDAPGETLFSDDFMTNESVDWLKICAKMKSARFILVNALSQNDE
jgi:hypothetical protein